MSFSKDMGVGDILEKGIIEHIAVFSITVSQNSILDQGHFQLTGLPPFELFCIMLLFVFKLLNVPPFCS